MTKIWNFEIHQKIFPEIPKENQIIFDLKDFQRKKTLEIISKQEKFILKLQNLFKKTIEIIKFILEIIEKNIDWKIILLWVSSLLEEIKKIKNSIIEFYSKELFISEKNKEIANQIFSILKPFSIEPVQKIPKNQNF